MKAFIKCGELKTSDGTTATYDIKTADIEGVGSFVLSTNEEIWRPLIDYVLKYADSKNYKLISIELEP